MYTIRVEISKDRYAFDPAKKGHCEYNKQE